MLPCNRLTWVPSVIPVNRTRPSTTCSSGVFHYSLTSHTVAARSHSCVCSTVHSCCHKEDVMLDPVPFYLFTPRVAHTSHAGVREQRRKSPAAVPFTPADGCEQEFWYNHQSSINLCCCTWLLSLGFRHTDGLRLHSFMRLLCINFVDMKITQSCTPLSRHALHDRLLCLSVLT